MKNARSNSQTQNLESQVLALQEELEQLKAQNAFLEGIQEQQLEKNQETEHLANMGSWEVDLQTQEVHWSDGMYALLRVGKTIAPDMSIYKRKMQPTEVDKLDGAIRKVFVSQQRYALRHQLEVADNELLTVELVLKIVFKENGQPCKLIGIVRDISEERAAQEELQKLSMIASQTSNAVVVMDSTGVIEWVNDGFVRVTGFTFEEICNTCFYTFLLGGTEEEHQKVDEWLARKFEGRTSLSMELEIKTKTTKPLWVLVNLTSILDYELQVERYIAIIVNIDERKKAQNQLQAANQRLLVQNQAIEQKNKNITDSIRYAKRIQEALVVGEEHFNSRFADIFVLNQPKDIVSGDFYWMHQSEEICLIVLADCTGHGVPGAFMTILGTTLLNQLVKEQGITAPSEILTKLDKKVREALHSQQSKRQDGMDMTILKIDYQRQEITFAGANNPLVYVHQGEMQLIKGSKFAVGSSQYKKEKIFESHQIPFCFHNKYYLFSDGFQDQFGGADNKKYLSRRFRSFLQKNQHLPMSRQKDLLYQEFHHWKDTYPQTDDILVLGLQLVAS